MATGFGPFRVTSLNAAILDETFGVPVDCHGCPYVVVYVKGTGVTSSGVVTLEEADWNPATDLPFSGTWSPITTVNASDVDGGLQKAIHLPEGAYGFVRPRISTVIGGGGSVTVVVRGIGS